MYDQNSTATGNMSFTGADLSKAVSWMEEILCSKSLRKLDGSTGEGERFNKDMFSMTDFTREDTCWHSDGH